MKYKSGIMLPLFILIHISVWAMPLDSIGVTKINNKMHVRYFVSPGETIYGISTKYGVSVSDLMELNPEIEHGLKVGQVINIPYNPETIKSVKKSEDNAIVHKVLPGETYYGISKKYNISLAELMQLNNIELKAGQEIIVGYKNQTKPVVSEVTKEDDNKAPKNNVAEDKPVKAEPVTKQPSEVKPVSKDNVEKIQVINRSIEKYDFDTTKKQVLVIPFDPYLYFSDADDEIAAKSNIPRTKVRHIFRKRLNSMLEVPGYETIHLLGGKAKDSLSDMNKIYSMVTYNYQQVKPGPYYEEPVAAPVQKNKTWLEKQKDKLSGPQSDSKYDIPKDHGSFFGVVIKNPEFYSYFNEKYSVDYYVFISQFEVKTNYENCLDRAALNYERTFTTHFSIFDSSGKQLTGNKFKTNYNSNSNYIYKIVADNMEKIANRIISELPPPRQ